MSKFKKHSQALMEANKKLTLRQSNICYQWITTSDLVELKCSDGRDKYLRLTCNIFDEKGDSLNLQMVKEGYAYAMPSQCFSKAEGVLYLTHQHLTKFSQIGL